MTLLPYASKGLIGVGFLSLLTGTLSSILSVSQEDTSEATSETALDYGMLTETLASSVRKINIACSFFPKTSAILSRLHRHIVAFVEVYHEMMELPQYKNKYAFARRLVRIQRKLFNDVDDLILEQSETIAIEDLFNATDDFKQQITNLCLNLDH